MLDWYSCQICYPLEIKLLLFIVYELLENLPVKNSWKHMLN